MDYIKIIVYQLVRLLMKVFCVFPVKKNRLLFESYKGKAYSCNPKYICEYLLHIFPEHFEIIWVLVDVNNTVLPDGVKAVRKRSLLNIYYHMTSKIIIANNIDDMYIPNRKSQVFINTWHAGGAYKRIGHSYGLKRQSVYSEWEDRIINKETTYFISSSELFTKYNIKEAYLYDGIILNCGMPRNDIFFDHEKIKKAKVKIEQKYHVDGKNTILYAPTFRGDFGKATEPDVVFPFEDIENAFKKDNKNVSILNRSHYSLSAYSMSNMKSVIDVSDYPDMQELLAAADILVTDYSSSIWDYSITGKPCILYVPDKESYLSERGLFTEMKYWPGIVVTTKDELIFELTHPRYEVSKRKAAEALNYYHSYENGHASEFICNIIKKECL